MLKVIKQHGTPCPIWISLLNANLAWFNHKSYGSWCWCWQTDLILFCSLHNLSFSCTTKSWCRYRMMLFNENHMWNQRAQQREVHARTCDGCSKLLLSYYFSKQFLSAEHVQSVAWSPWLKTFSYDSIHKGCSYNVGTHQNSDTHTHILMALTSVGRSGWVFCVAWLFWSKPSHCFSLP